MVLNSQYVGKTYPRTEPYRVSREKIREFARAIGETHPACHDVAAARAEGYADLVAPPTFGFVVTMTSLEYAMGDAELGLDYSRVVHGEQSFETYTPLVAGVTVVVDASIETIDSTGRNELLTLRADILTEAGALLVTTRSVLVSRGTGTAAGARS